MKRKLLSFFLMAGALVCPLASAMAQTQVNLATQAKGVLPNGSAPASMATQAGVQSQSYSFGVGTGSANAQVVTLTPVPGSYAAGMMVIWLPAAANTTTTPTVNVNALGAKTIVKVGGAALAANDLTTSALAVAIYDGTNFELQNPQTGVAPTAPAFSSLTDGATVTWAIASAAVANGSLLFTVHSGSRTLNLTGLANGGSYVLKLQQDSTGGEGLTLGTGCTWKVSVSGSGFSGTTVTPVSTANGIDVLAFTYDGANCLATFN
jgi:hypothetical protein